MAKKPFRYEVKVEEVRGQGVRIVREAAYMGCLSDTEFSGQASSDTIFSDVSDDVLLPVVPE